MLIFLLPLFIGYAIELKKDLNSIRRIIISEESIIFEYFSKKKIKEETAKLLEIKYEENKTSLFLHKRIEIVFSHQSYFIYQVAFFEQFLINNASFFNEASIKLNLN